MATMRLHHGWFVFGLAALVYVLLATWLAASPAEARVLAASPDHPRTFWTSGFEERDKYVEWNAILGGLEAHVVYATPSYTDSWNPVLYDHFKARFPGVRLNVQEGSLYVLGRHKQRVTIGHLEPGVYGSRVQLEKDVDLSMQRRDGHLDAALVTASN